MKLINPIQDLIDTKTIVVDPPQENNDHKTFKEPFPKFEKGDSSKAKDNKISYTYSNSDNMINMLESSYHTKEKAKDESSNVTTHSQEKFTPPGESSSSSSSPKKEKTSTFKPSPSSALQDYNLVDQL